MFKEKLDPNRIPYFLCIGVPFHFYDSLGPLIGSKLELLGYNVLGTITNPIHAMNISERMREVEAIDTSVYQLIAVDAVLTKEDYLYVLRDGPCRPGAGIKRKLPSVGELSILVNPFYDRPKMKLWRRRLELYFCFSKNRSMMNLTILTLVNEIRFSCPLSR